MVNLTAFETRSWYTLQQCRQRSYLQQLSNLPQRRNQLNLPLYVSQQQKVNKTYLLFWGTPRQASGIKLGNLSPLFDYTLNQKSKFPSDRFFKYNSRSI